MGILHKAASNKLGQPHILATLTSLKKSLCPQQTPGELAINTLPKSESQGL